MKANMEQKPIPSANADTRPFWEACNREELIYQYCPACRRAQFYPRAVCAVCGATSLEWRISRGLGTVYTFTRNYRAPNPAFADEIPYVIALVDLEEGFRMMVNIQGCPPEAVHIGLPVRIVFETRGDQKVPQGVPREAYFSP